MKTIGKYYDCSLRTEASETSSTCHAEAMTTCRDAVGTTAKWTITLTNVVGSKHVLRFVASPLLSRDHVLNKILHNYHLCRSLARQIMEVDVSYIIYSYTFDVTNFPTNVVFFEISPLSFSRCSQRRSTARRWFLSMNYYAIYPSFVLADDRFITFLHSLNNYNIDHIEI